MTIVLALLAGCAAPEEASRGEADPPGITFDDVAPILFQNCTSCHRPGESVPFVLMDYADAESRAVEISREVRSREMPPWLPTDGELEFENDRRLSDEEIELIRLWVKQGAPEGEPGRAPAPPRAGNASKRDGTGATVLRIDSGTIDIPAGAAEHVVSASGQLPEAAELLGLELRAHDLCAAIEVTALAPGGGRTTLLRIDDWELDLSEPYRYRRPVPLEAGTTIEVRFGYDTSEGAGIADEIAALSLRLK
jgi:hypothetical protein